MTQLLRVQCVGFYTIVRKELVRVCRIWTQTLLPSVVTTTLYFLIFGGFIGSRIGLVHGVNYMQFIVPGLIMMSVVTNAYANVSSSFFGAKFQKNVEEMLVSPLNGAVIVLGFLSAGVLRGGIVGLLVTGVAAFFTPLVFHHLGIVIVTVLLSATLFATLGFLNAMVARKFDDISIVPTFVLTPLIYLGGVFYSINALPPFFQWVSLANPIVYLINLFRYGFLGFSDVSVWGSMVSLIVVCLAFVGLAIYLFDRGTGIRQ